MKKLLFLILLPVLSFPLFAQTADLRGLKTVVSQLEGQTAVVGKQYAVLIAINKYENWMALQNPVEDAKEIKDILSQRYFITDFIELYDKDATKAGIIRLFNRLINDAKPEDSVLIFYAGHGFLDKTSNTGFWIPVDGGMDVYEQANWLPNAQIRGFISNMKARHIALIADSCFSGDFLNPTRGIAPTITNQYFKNAYARISRQVLTSGASESVPDESQFTRQLKLALEGNTSPYLDPLMLYNQIRLGVTQTTPLLGDLKDSGHQEGSSFLLFLKDKGNQAAASNAATSSTQSPKTTFKLAKIIGKVTITTKTTGTLLLDGAVQGQIPADRLATIENLEEGSHELEMQYENGQTEKIPVTIDSEEPLSIKFERVFLAASNQAATSAEAPAKIGSTETLRDGDPLPQASIKIDGDFGDWNGILPAFLITELPESNIALSLAIDKVYLAVDGKNLYMRFDIKDVTMNSSIHPHNFFMDQNCTYCIDLTSGAYHVDAKVTFDANRKIWFTSIGLSFNGQYLKDIEKAYINVAMKGFSMESSFPLEPIMENLGPLYLSGYSSKVSARTGRYDDKWNWVNGSGNVTKEKQFTFPSSAQLAARLQGQAAPSVEAPQNSLSSATLRDGDPLPLASIKIDGDFSDWNGILPAFSHQGSASHQNLAIDKVYLAVDTINLYMRLDIMDATPSSFFHTHNFYMDDSSSYGLDLENGLNHVVTQVNFDNSLTVRRWYVEIGRIINGNWETIDKKWTWGNYAMKDSSLEASFPLKTIKQYLGSTLGCYHVSVRTFYFDSRWIAVQGSGDTTEAKQFIF